MFITISKTQDNRYIFGVGDDPDADQGSWVRSDVDATILGDTPSSFSTFGEAHAFASRLADDHPSCVMAKKASFYKHCNDVEPQTMSAEDQTISHYNEQVEFVAQRLFDIRNFEGKDAIAEALAVKKEIEGIKQEVANITPMVESESGKKRIAEITKKLESYLQAISKTENTKQASVTPFPSDLSKVAIRVFSEAAMVGLSPRHKDVFVKSASFVPSSGTHEVILSTVSEGDLVKLAFDKNLLLSDIVPYGISLEKCGGRSSMEFLTGYWEPIVNAVGHFHSKGNSAVAVTSLVKGRRFCFSGFDMTDNSKISVIVSNTKILGKESWLVKKAILTTKPVDSPIPIKSEVICINASLPTYKDRTGEVTEVAEKLGRFEYRVDFRRGIGIVWLEDKDIRRVDIGH